MLGRLVGRCTLGMSFVFRENSGWHGVATPVCQQSGLSPWHVYLCWGKEFHTAANWGVQPVNTRLSGFVCLVKRGALGPDSSSLYFTRNPFVCHFMRNPERWRCRGRAVAPVWVKRATSPSSRGSLGVHGVFPEQGLPDLAQCSFLADEWDSSSLPKAP